MGRTSLQATHYSSGIAEGPTSRGVHRRRCSKACIPLYSSSLQRPRSIPATTTGKFPSGLYLRRRNSNPHFWSRHTRSSFEFHEATATIDGRFANSRVRIGTGGLASALDSHYLVAAHHSPILDFYTRLELPVQLSHLLSCGFRRLEHLESRQVHHLYDRVHHRGYLP